MAEPHERPARSALACALVASVGGGGLAAFEKVRAACGATACVEDRREGALVRIAGAPERCGRDEAGRAWLVQLAPGRTPEQLVAALPQPDLAPLARLAHALERDGPAAFERLRGGFALLGWDPARGSLGLARDREGAGQLLLAEQSLPQGVESVLVAGRLAPLLDAGLLRRRLDPLALASYLWRGELVGTRTLALGVRRVRAGAWTTITARERTIRESAFAALALPDPGEAAPAPRADASAAHALLRAPSGALGVLLSGGPASLALAHVLRAQRPRLVHLVAPERGAEAAAACEAFARAHALELHLVEPAPARLDAWLDALPARADEPGLAALEACLAAELAREQGFALTLLGSGGVERHAASASAARGPSRSPFLPRLLARTLAARALERDRRLGTRTRARREASPALRHHLATALASPALAHALLDPERLPPLALGLARERVDELDRRVAALDPQAAWRALELEARREPTLAALAAASEPGGHAGAGALELAAPWLAAERDPAWSASFAALRPARQEGGARRGLAAILAAHLCGPRRARLLDELGARDAADALGLEPQALRSWLQEPQRHPPVDPLAWLALWLLARWSAARAIRV